MNVLHCHEDSVLSSQSTGNPKHRAIYANIACSRSNILLFSIKVNLKKLLLDSMAIHEGFVKFVKLCDGAKASWPSISRLPHLTDFDRDGVRAAHAHIDTLTQSLVVTVPR